MITCMYVHVALLSVNTHQVAITGKDAEVFLERILVADLRKLQLGEGTYRICMFVHHHLLYMRLHVHV